MSTDPAYIVLVEGQKMPRFLLKEPVYTRRQAERVAAKLAKVCAGRRSHVLEMHVSFLVPSEEVARRAE
jgi:hypothetical protein